MRKEYGITDHPCFSRKASNTYGRVHLPVAPWCNIRCNYCDRRYDCPNEGRPGVTSRVMSPGEALGFLEGAMAAGPVSVVGIAGPGDPLANPEHTFAALELVKENHPGLLRCISTNGLAVLPYLREVTALASHITLTVNAVDEEVGARIYDWVNPGDRVRRGREGAAFLLERQLEAVARVKAAGLAVKVNTVVIPGVNDGHVIDIARVMKDLGVDLFNAMPLYPVAGTKFEDIREPYKREIRMIREKASGYLPQMSHCSRCRADAAGLIGGCASREEACL